MSHGVCAAERGRSSIIRREGFRSLPEVSVVTFTSWPKSAWTPPVTTIEAMVHGRTTTRPYHDGRSYPCALLGNLGQTGSFLRCVLGRPYGGQSRVCCPNGPSTVLPFPTSTHLKNVVETGKFGGKPARSNAVDVFGQSAEHPHRRVDPIIIPAMECTSWWRIRS